MVGIRAIGWWLPKERRSAAQIAKHYGVSEEALREIGLQSHVVPGPEDHPSTMGARATDAALRAAGLRTDALDLLIYAGVTKDFAVPWVGAFGVLHALGHARAAGFDIGNRCAAGLDALWIAKQLVASGTYRTVGVCCAERYDYLFAPPRPVELATDATFSAGAACALITADAESELVGYAHLTNPDLSIHHAAGPPSGGSRSPLREADVAAGRHRWVGQLSIPEAHGVASFAAEADRHNLTEVMKQAGFDDVDFIGCSPLNVRQHGAALSRLGIPPERTVFTLPHVGHVGAADCLLSLAVARALGRPIGPRSVLSSRSLTYACAVALRSRGDDACIAFAGEGIDTAWWQS